MMDQPRRSYIAISMLLVKEFEEQYDPLMPDLEDTAEVQNTGIFGSAFDDEDLDTYNSPFVDQVMGAEADFNNMEPSTSCQSYVPQLEEPIKIAQALDDESWVEAMQEELLQFKIQKMDIKSAFLYGTIEEEAYVRQPPGFVDPEFPKKVYKVEKALYWLQQAPRAWWQSQAPRYHGGAPAQTRSERVIEQSIESPLSEGNTSGSREDRMEH
ncbi:putative ribonuclease H-like domain-containing protein [Tanacetum coccineum]